MYNLHYSVDHNFLSCTGAIALAKGMQQNKSLKEMKWVVNLLILWWCYLTVLSQASAQGHSQLKRQKLKLGGCMEEVIKWFNFPCTRAYPECEVSCQRVPNWLALLLCLCFVKASPTVEKAVSCYKVDRLIALLPIFLGGTSGTWILCCRRKTLRTRPWIGVCNPLMPNVVVPKVHQNSRS